MKKRKRERKKEPVKKEEEKREGMNGEERKIEGEKEWHSYRGARERKKKEKVGEERERGKS